MAVCLLAGVRIAALRVELARPKPKHRDHARVYREFFGGPVAFAGTRCRIIYTEASLSQPLAHSDHRLALLLQRQAEARLERSQRPANLREQVSRRLLEQLRTGQPDPELLARSLRMSPRTLRRRLLAIGCSYRELLDEVRHREALRLMRKGELAVGEAAERLGFDDASAFARAFRRWTGSSPSSVKRSRA
jgi:AraC-like DNA-binding protein